MDVSVLSSPASTLEASTSPQPLFSVILVLLDAVENWKPKTIRTPLPSENSSLPLSIALELAEHLNTCYRKIKRNRVAVVTRSINGGSPRYGVSSVEAFPKKPGEHAAISRVKATGLTAELATGEVERLNRQILDLARIPKFWAVMIVESVGEAVTA